MSSFKKKWSVRDFAVVALCVWGPLPSYDPILPPPPWHSVYVCSDCIQFTYSDREGGGMGRSNQRRLGAIVHKASRKYQHYWLCRQSINSIKHQQRWHLGFGVFIVVLSMLQRYEVRDTRYEVWDTRWKIGDMARLCLVTSLNWTCGFFYIYTTVPVPLNLRYRGGTV